MFNQSNPLAITGMALLTAVFLYEYRAVFVDLFQRFLDLLSYLIPATLCVLAFVGVGLFLNWLGWHWLLIGLGRMMGGSVLLVCLWTFWTGVGLPFVQKLSRRRRATRL